MTPLMQKAYNAVSAARLFAIDPAKFHGRAWIVLPPKFLSFTTRGAGNDNCSCSLK